MNMTKTTEHFETDYRAEAQLFRALSHPVRLAILDILRDGEQCVCHMEAILGLRQAYISQHLMVLREAGLVADRKDGWNVFYRVVRPEVYRAKDAFAGRTGARPQRVMVHANAECTCPKCQKQE